MASDQYEARQRTNVVETASATTSPDNARSGHFAHVIALIAIAVLGMSGTALAGCMTLVTDILEDEFYGYGSSPYNQLLDEQLDERDYDSIDDYLDDYFNRLYERDGTIYPRGNGDDSLTENGDVLVKDILETDLGIYQSTLDQLLPVSAYANAQESVRTYVRDLVVADRDASSLMAGDLRDAAWSDESPSEALAEASQQAQDMVKTLQGMALPRVDGENSTAISRSLEIGRGKAIDRWRAIADELDLLATNDEVDAQAALEADELVTQAAQEAADAFAEALSVSAAR